MLNAPHQMSVWSGTAPLRFIEPGSLAGLPVTYQCCVKQAIRKTDKTGLDQLEINFNHKKWRVIKKGMNSYQVYSQLSDSIVASGSDRS
nr:hypothetical protein [uncultured Methanospirillum sp.]